MRNLRRRKWSSESCPRATKCSRKLHKLKDRRDLTSKQSIFFTKLSEEIYGNKNSSEWKILKHVYAVYAGEASQEWTATRTSFVATRIMVRSVSGWLFMLHITALIRLSAKKCGSSATACLPSIQWTQQVPQPRYILITLIAIKIYQIKIPTQSILNLFLLSVSFLYSINGSSFRAWTRASCAQLLHFSASTQNNKLKTETDVSRNELHDEKCFLFPHDLLATCEHKNRMWMNASCRAR